MRLIERIARKVFSIMDWCREYGKIEQLKPILVTKSQKNSMAFKEPLSFLLENSHQDLF